MTTANGYQQNKSPFDNLFVWVIVFILMCFLAKGLTGCRTVHKSQSIEKKDVDSLVITKHDSSTIENYTNWDDYFSSDSIAVHIEFKDSSKHVVKTPMRSSFIDNLIQLANSGNVKVLDINAKKLKDSANYNSAIITKSAKNDTTTHKTDNSKFKSAEKDVHSNTALFIVLGVVFIASVYGLYVYKTANKPMDAVEKVVNKIEK